MCVWCVWVVYSRSLTPYPQTTSLFDASSSPSVTKRRLFTSKRQPFNHHPLHGSGEPRHVEHGLAPVQGCYACSGAYARWGVCGLGVGGCGRPRPHGAW